MSRLQGQPLVQWQLAGACRKIKLTSYCTSERRRGCRWVFLKDRLVERPSLQIFANGYVGRFDHIRKLSLVRRLWKVKVVDGQNSSRLRSQSSPTPLANTVGCNVGKLEQQLNPWGCPYAHPCFVLRFPWVLAQINPSIQRGPSGCNDGLHEELCALSYLL